MSQYKLDPWIEGYLDYLRDVKRNHPRSIVDARCTLKKASEFMERHRPVVPLWKASLDDYLCWLSGQRERGRAESVLAKDLSHLRGLFDYTWRSGRCDRNVLDGFSLSDRVPRRPPRALTIEEAERLVGACSRGTSTERRSRIIVLLLYGCGLRPFELCNLDVADVNIERAELFVRRGKGERQRTIPVPAAVWTELLAYLTERGSKRGPLFRTAVKKKRISTRNVGEVVRQAVMRAGIEGHVTPKTLRHTFATHLMDRGVDVAVIASLMGHRSPNETGVYLHALPGRREAAVKQLDLRMEDSE